MNTRPDVTWRFALLLGIIAFGGMILAALVLSEPFDLIVAGLLFVVFLVVGRQATARKRRTGAP